MDRERNTMDKNPSDEELLAGLRQGREDMFEELVHRYEGRLFAFISRMVGREADAADLFQETFVRVYAKAGQVRDTGSFRAWLYTIAANLCRSHHARRLRQAEVPIQEFDESARPAPGSAPDADLDRREVGDRIAAAVNGLPAEQKEVFILKVYQDLNYTEIAQALSRPLGTVKSQMRYALMKLRGVLRDMTVDRGVAEGRMDLQ